MWKLDDEITCKTCGKREKLSWNDETLEEMEKHQMCFKCNFWNHYAELKDDPSMVRIEGSHYVARQGIVAASRWNGFGGAKFKIKFHDGREVETNNLWHQGKIPEHFLTKLPDNAKFIRG